MEDLIMVGYSPGVVFITGGNGGNAELTGKKLLTTPGVKKVYFHVRREEVIPTLKGSLRSHCEGILSHGHAEYEVVCGQKGLEAMEGAHILINWAGVPVAALDKLPPQTVKERRKMGLLEREMLLPENLPAIIPAAKLFLQVSGGIFMTEANPSDAFTGLLVSELGYDPRRIFSTGDYLEYHRIVNVLCEKLHELYGHHYSMRNFSGLCIGGHGTEIIPSKKISLGGVDIESFMQSIDPKSGLQILHKVYAAIHTEAFWIRKQTGKTPADGPSSVTADIVGKILDTNGLSSVTHLCVAMPNKHYGMELGDAATVPVSLGPEGIERVIEINLTKTENQAFQNFLQYIRMAIAWGREICKSL